MARGAHYKVAEVNFEGDGMVLYPDGGGECMTVCLSKHMNRTIKRVNFPLCKLYLEKKKKNLTKYFLSIS